MDERNLYEMIKRIVFEETKFLRNYIGKVLDNQDIYQKGKILVSVPALLWTTNDKACWCKIGRASCRERVSRHV